MHIHVAGPDGEAKFWLEPIIGLAVNYRMAVSQLKEIQKFIEGHENEIKNAWKKHFSS